MATRWTYPDPSSPTYKAMKLYRNYDGSKSTFGETSVAAGVPNPDNVAAFASVRSSDGALTVMVISKYLANTTPVTLSLANFANSGTAQAWQLTSANTINRLADVTYSNGSLAATVPSQSVTLFVLKGDTAPTAPTRLTAREGRNSITLQWVQSASAGVTQNRIYRSRKSEGQYNLLATINAGTNYTDTDLSRSAIYSYVVTARSGAGLESGYSNSASGRTR